MAKVIFKFSWIFEPQFRWFLDRVLDSKRKHRFCRNSALACTGARFLRFQGIRNQQKINKKSMQNKNEKMIHVFTSWLSKTWKITKKYVKKYQEKQIAFLMRILLIFASILALKNPFKSPCPSTFFRHFPQDTSKMPPRRLQGSRVLFHFFLI